MIGIRRALFAVWFYGTLTVMSLMAVFSLLGPKEWTVAWVRSWFRVVIWGLRHIMGITVEFRGAISPMQAKTRTNQNPFGRNHICQHSSYSRTTTSSYWPEK